MVKKNYKKNTQRDIKLYTTHLYDFLKKHYSIKRYGNSEVIVKVNSEWDIPVCFNTSMPLPVMFNDLCVTVDVWYINENIKPKLSLLGYYCDLKMTIQEVPLCKLKEEIDKIINDINTGVLTDDTRRMPDRLYTESDCIIA